jgi:hypothetical protein
MPSVASPAAAAISAPRRNKAPFARLTVSRRRTKSGSRLIANGASSRDLDGRIVRYEWRLNGKLKTACRARRCLFRVGRHRTQRITLTVVDNLRAKGIARRTLARTKR